MIRKGEYTVDARNTRKILFLGDSITDCDHCFTRDNLGTGYVKYMAEALSGHLFLTNGGVDGFTLPRIYRKWQRMWSGQCFDTVFLLGGINDVGDIMAQGDTEKIADSVLADAQDAFDVLLRGLITSGCHRIVVTEPFLFSVPDELLTWRPRLNEFCQLLRTRTAQIRKEFPSASLSCISVQERFDAAAAKDGVQHMTTDGVHLTEQGHRILAKILLTYL